MSLPTSASATAYYAAATLLPVALCIIVYSLAFDPLRHYRGPLIARFTDAYAGYHAVRRRLHLQTFSDLQQYGTAGVYRQGPNRLVFNTVKALHDIYNHPRIAKARAYRYTSLEGQENLLSTLDPQIRRQKRKVYGRLLSDRALHTFEPTVAAETDVFLRQIRDAGDSGRPVNMTPLCERLVTDVSGLLAFGYALETQSKDDNRFLPRAMMGRLALANMFVAWPLLHIMGLTKVAIWWNKAKFDAFRALLTGIIKSRVALPKDAKHDFYSVAATGKEHTPEKTRELWGEATFLVPAGGMTTAGTLTAAFFHLSRHPAAYARLASEIRTTFPDAKAITGGPLLASCTYLRAVIDESLRLSVPTTSMPWRDVPSAEASPEPFVVDGHVVPPGTMVVVSTYCLMRNEAYFPDPLSFKPERWLDEEADSKTQRQAFVPFGMGEAMCLGKSFAYLEASLTLAKTLWAFDFKRAPGEAGKLGGGSPGARDRARAKEDEFQLYDGIVSDHDGPNLVFTARTTS